MKMADSRYPAMKSSRNISCSLGYRRVSKPDKQVKPTVPTTAKNIVNPLRTFSPVEVLGTRRPLCRNNRSAPNDRSRNIVVIIQPVTNNGLSSEAPTSDMYAIVWFPCIDAYLVRCVSTIQCIRSPKSVASHIRPDMIGNIQYDRNRMVDSLILEILYV